MEDSSHSNQSGFGVSLNLDDEQNVTSGTLNANNAGHEMEGLTQATLGAGNIQVNGQALDDSNAPEGLNREVADAQITTLDMDTGGLNASMTVDGQFLTKKGREEVIKNHLEFADNTLAATAGAVTDAAAVTAVAGSSIDVVTQLDVGQAVNAFNTTINGKDLAYAQGGAVAGMTEAMRDGDVDDAQAMQDGLNDIDQILSGGEGDDRVRVVDGVVNAEGNGVHGAAPIGGDTMFVGMGEEGANSLVNTVAHEGMHLGGAGETNAHVTGFLTDMTYRLNARVNQENINEHRPDPIGVQDPTANAQLLASNNALFRVMDDRGELNYRDFDEAEAGKLDQARLSINTNMVMLPEAKQQANEELNAIACAEVRCAAGVSERDPHYETLKALQDSGDALKAEGRNIESTLDGYGVENDPDDDDFGYGLLDRGGDFIDKNENVVAGAGQLTGVVAGGAEAVAGNAMIAAGCTVGAAFSFGASCAVGAPVGTAVYVDGSVRASDNLTALTSEHQFESGENVVNSFSMTTYTDDFHPLRDVANSASEELMYSAAGTLVAGAPVVMRAADKAAGAIVRRTAQTGSAVDDTLDVTSTVRENYDYYEVITDIPISGNSRSAHRNSANKNLASELLENSDYRNSMNEVLNADVLEHMNSGSGANLRNPPGTEWHHPIDNPASMYLLKKEEHRNPMLQDLLHSGENGQGGFGKYFGGNE